MKIDFVIGRLKAGGAERVVSIVANYFAEHNHTVRIITFIDGDAYELDPRVERIRFHKKGLIKPAIIRGFFSLLKFYFKSKNRPDIINSHIGLMGYTSIPVGRMYNIKVINSEHMNHLHQNVDFPMKFLWNNLYKYADAITILTKFDLAFFKSRNKKVVVMENPCSFDIGKSPTNIREKVIVAVGNLDRYEHKGFDNLIEIASRVLKNHVDWKLKIVGGGNYGMEILKNMANEYGIYDQVIFTGFRSDIKEILSNAEIFILSSRYEGLPMVLLEALSQGLACISYDCISGPSEILENNVTGLLIADQDKDAMAKGLERLILDDNLRNGLRERSSTALDKFSIERVGQKWNNLFQDILLMQN
ncbi:glycosyltransferase family 4 protein [Flavobacteriaceae bacterium TP-CH-4]|uniref:Glycosyltransferase family 4 protein n=1 Tax=Pelagihabitans pacificus TaxID=2696054 RepID=A0A967AYB5_9FLAO|nr:glycosyltransferase family 4 protein [Pelagihabitans pacificus]NHF61535.1 glycosyltransferase family 4 protein [Pelagihabitans pacificus]